jgi:hypothetical protein
MWSGSRVRLGAAASTAAVLALGAATPAAATPRAVDPEQIQYQFTLRAAPVESYTYFFRELVQAAGFSRVQLAHERGDVSGVARALGAAVWPITDEEPCLLGCEPPCPESTVVNPTVARTSAPPECNNRVPGTAASGLPPELAALLSEGVAPEIVATTPDDTTATGSARIGDLDHKRNSFDGAGSLSTARVDRYTGKLVASAQTFVTELRLPDGDLASITSRLEVTARPDELPQVSYLLSLVGAAGGGNRSGLDQANFTISGNKIPITDFVQGFNDSVANVGAQLRILAGLGVRVLSPTADFTEVGTRFRVSAPVLMVGVEPSVNLPAPTRDGGVRIGAATFEGSYGAPDPPLR